MRAKVAVTGAAALLTTVFTACANPATETATPTASVSVSTVATTSAGAIEPHNNADVMFANHMIPHHEQAIEMSDIVLAKPGVDAAVLDLATRIKAAQGPEIEQMRSWLAQWGSPTGMSGHDMGDMGSMPGMDGMGMMTGMLSEADITALRSAPGSEAGKLYVTQMIEHHRGAITMAQDEIDDGQAPSAIELARAIVSVQQKEIDEMNALLPSL